MSLFPQIPVSLRPGFDCSASEVVLLSTNCVSVSFIALIWLRCLSNCTHEEKKRMLQVIVLQKSPTETKYMLRLQIYNQSSDLFFCLFLLLNVFSYGWGNTMSARLLQLATLTQHIKETLSTSNINMIYSNNALYFFSTSSITIWRA